MNTADWLQSKSGALPGGVVATCCHFLYQSFKMFHTWFSDIHTSLVCCSHTPLIYRSLPDMFLPVPLSISGSDQDSGDSADTSDKTTFLCSAGCSGFRYENEKIQWHMCDMTGVIL